MWMDSDLVDLAWLNEFFALFDLNRPHILLEEVIA